jgi:hypothetical protein
VRTGLFENHLTCCEVRKVDDDDYDEDNNNNNNNNKV